MIKNFSTNTQKRNDAIILAMIIAAFLFVVWLCTPPGNKFIQMAFWGSNTRLFFAKLTNSAATTEWIFHRNNAVYLSKMKNKEAALLEIDKALMTFPSYGKDKDMSKLYKDRAQIRMFWGDYKGALEDYLHSDNIDIQDSLRVAMLYKLNGNYKEAMSYCNRILDLNYTAYPGFACMADIYAVLGRYDLSVKVFDLLIDRVKNRPMYYADRARYKKAYGDTIGYDEDMQKARELSPTAKLDYSIIEETLHPRILRMDIMPVK